MATITSLERAKDVPEAEVTGNLVTATETWHLIIGNGITSPIGARALVSALRSGNSFGWMVVGVDSHPDDSSMYSTGFSVERLPNNTVQFLVTTTLTNDIEDINSARSALDAEPVYDYQEVDTIIEVDIDPLTEEAIAASNGQAYFPKVQRKGTDTRIVINRNEDRFDPRFARDYRNKLNETPLTIDGRSYDERTILLESWTGRSAIDTDGSEYYQVVYQLLYDPGEHKIELIDAALGPDKDGNNPKINGQNEVHKLDGDGLFLGKAAQEDPTNFQTNEFNVHEEINMQNLRL